MKVLLIGRSRIGQKRVLPALQRVSGITEVTIASRRGEVRSKSELRSFDDYESAISESGADLAYISLENSNHAQWTERALQRGLHVVVDKPAFLTHDDARRLADVAASKRRCLAEATVFPFHPQVEAIRDFFQSVGSAPTRVVALFSFPPLDAADFRNWSDRGGGALYDVGPYAVATSRLFFGRPPCSVQCDVLGRGSQGVDSAFSVLMRYEGGGALAGHFGFDTEYQNRLIAFGPGGAADLSRAFTLPPDAANRVMVRRNNVESELAIAPADSFALFLSAVVAAIDRGRWGEFTDALLDDAALLARLRTSSGEQ